MRLAIATVVLLSGCAASRNDYETMAPCPANDAGAVVACSDGPNDLTYTQVLAHDTILATSSAGQCSSAIILPHGNYTLMGIAHYGEPGESIPCAFDATVKPCKSRNYACPN